jgi:Tol biopolymer transport system component
VTGKYGDGQRLILQDLKGGQAIEISKAPKILYPRWSPDDSELAVFRDDPPQRGVFLIPRLGGSSRFIAGGGHTTWSPDGSKIATAWQNEVGVTIMDKATGSAKSVQLSGFRAFDGLDWSPASNRLAILTILENGRKAIWTVRPDGGQQRKVVEEGGACFTSLVSGRGRDLLPSHQPRRHPGTPRKGRYKPQIRAIQRSGVGVVERFAGRRLLHGVC